jgi:FdhD protein
MTREEHPGKVRSMVDRGEGPRRDWLVVEEPLEIRVDGEPLAVTLRTPGDDERLAAGFLFTEGVVEGPHDVLEIARSTDPTAYDPDNLVEVRLRPEARQREERLQRARRELMATAACGLCGKARLEHVFQRLPRVRPLEVGLDFVRALPSRMRRHQELFRATGGLHAAALFTPGGEMLALFEDVGRHNAVDKLIGHFLLTGELPLADRILVVSARAGFEIVQKARMAEVPVLVAVGAATELAARTAREGGMTLFSFVAGEGGNRHL